METKVCKVCGRELPETDFPMGRYGIRIGTCKECRTAALRQTKAAKRAQMGGVKPLPFPMRPSTAKASATYGVLCAAPRNGLRAVATSYSLTANIAK